MRHWKVVLAVLELCASAVIRMLGFNIYVVISLVVIAIGTLIWSAWPTLVSLRVQSPIMLKPSKKANLVVTEHPKRDKLQIVLKAIGETRQITPLGNDVIVYMTRANGLATAILPEELKSSLLKLQNDDKVLILKSFPEWLLERGKISKTLHLEIQSLNNPSLKSFTVSLLDEFDKYIEKYKNYNNAKD